MHLTKDRELYLRFKAIREKAYKRNMAHKAILEGCPLDLYINKTTISIKESMKRTKTPNSGRRKKE